MKGRFYKATLFRLWCTDAQEKTYKHGETIEKKYSISSANEVEKYEVTFSEYDGVDLLSRDGEFAYYDDKNSFSVKFRVKDKAEPGYIKFTVKVTFKDEAKEPIIRSQVIYVCNVAEADFVCQDCIDGLAEYSEVIKDYLHEIDSLGEHHVEYQAEESQDKLNNRTIRSVSGYIRWTDSVGNTHPAEGVTVQIYKGTGSYSSLSLYDTVTTSSTGYYYSSYSYDATSPIIRIRVLSSGTNVNVISSGNAVYQYDSNIYGGSSNNEISYTASNTSYLGRSMSVHQALALANRYMYTLENSYMNSIDVKFPSTDGTHYTSSPKSIYIPYADAFDWDVIEHEYGHYVADVYGLIASFTGNNWHYYTKNLADEYHNKSKGISMAWNEGWATYFAINVQKQMNASSMNIPNVGDILYQDTVDQEIEYSIESKPNEVEHWGEANETAVSAVLFDITDGINTNEADYISVPNASIWNVLKNNSPKSLSEFVGDYRSSSSISAYNRARLGSTLTQYEVAAKLTGYTVSDNTVTFTLIKQGGSTEYGNNSFRIVFFNSSFGIIYATNYFNSTTLEISRTMWDPFVNSTSPMYICIETKQTDSPITGPYYSNLIPVQ